MSPSTPADSKVSSAAPSPHSRSTSLDEVVQMTPLNSSSPPPERADDGLDDLFNDETTHGLDLPPIPDLARVASSDCGSTSNSQKRKRDSASSDGDSDDDSRDSPQIKKVKNTGEETEKENERKGDEAARRHHTLAVAASTKPRGNSTGKLFASMKKHAHIPIPKYVRAGSERRSEVNLLPKQRVRHVAPTMLANIATNRDIGGKMSKFDWADTKREIKQDQIKAPAHQLEKWVDKDDKDITWLVIPASRKFINMGDSMIRVADIVDKSFKYPEFTFVESIMGPHVKTGKQVVKAHKIKYEKLDDAQAILRMDIMVKQKGNELSLGRKD